MGAAISLNVVARASFLLDTQAMPVAVAFAPPDVFVVRATGVVTHAECQRALDDVLAHPAGRDGERRKLLVDARGVTAAPNRDELYAIARDMKTFINRGYGPMAIVTDQTFVYGVARMFAVFAETFGLSVRAFKSFEGASEWLSKSTLDIDANAS